MYIGLKQLSLCWWGVRNLDLAMNNQASGAGRPMVANIDEQKDLDNPPGSETARAF